MFLAGHATESGTGGDLHDEDDFVAAYESSSDDELADAITQLHGLISASEAELFSCVVAFSRRRSFEQDGCRNMTEWLVARLSISIETARRYARVADALAQLPHLRATFARGEVSLDQLAPVTRIATPESDALLAESLPGYSAAEAQAISQRARKLDPEDEAEAHSRRFLSLKRDGQCTKVSGRLSGIDGDTVRSALERIAERYGPDPETGTYEPFGARMADALCDLAGAAISEDADPDRADVVVHVDADVLAGTEEGAAETGSGRDVSAEAARRAACDCRRQTWTHDRSTGSIDIGRMSRSIPPSLRRYLRLRDGTCRFPGCGQTRLVAGHHMWHWGKGGPTDRANLSSLCRRHHRLVHEGGWKMEGNAEGTVTFVSPHGKRVSSTRAPFREEIRRRMIFDDVGTRGEESALSEVRGGT
jgi:hypothetical protein